MAGTATHSRETPSASRAARRPDRTERQRTQAAPGVRRVANREQTEALLRRRTHRARLGLLVSVIAAGTFVGLEFPIGELLHQRAEISLTAGQLAALTATDRSLAGQVTSLRSAGGIEHIAHEQYGLIYPGQTAYVVLPFSGDSDLADPLSEHPIPASDIVPAAPGAVAGPGRAAAAGRAGEGLWQRVIARLEFWRWAF
jgi:cell division protein FtsB